MSRRSLLSKIALGVALFGAGSLFGGRVQKIRHEKKTKYAGTLQIYTEDGDPQLYLALSVLPEDLVNLADVIFKVNNIADFTSTVIET